MSEEMVEVEKGRYWKGWLPISDTCWQVETLKNERFMKLGTIRVSGKKVSREMDIHRSIKGYEPYDLAKKMAQRKFGTRYALVVTKVKCRRQK